MKPGKILVRTLALAIGAIGAIGAGQMNAGTINPAVEYTTSDILSDRGPFTMGYEFTTSETLIVDALGYYDDSLANSHQVGIWDSVGNLITLTTVLGTDPVQGHFLWHSIPDFTLAAGTYTIGGEYPGNGDPFVFNASGIVTIPQYTWLADEQQYGAGLNYPTFNTGGLYGGNGILMANFSVQGAHGVPDAASTLALLSGAFAMLGAFGRRFRI